QISAILGPCAGGAVYSPAITDFIVMVKDTSFMFVTGPDVIKTVLHEDVSKADLGGAVAHSTKSGVSHFAADDEESAIRMVRELLSFMPQNNAEDPPRIACDDDPNRRDPKLETLIPETPEKPYDIREVVTACVDDGYFFEVQRDFAENIIVGFARL